MPINSNLDIRITAAPRVASGGRTEVLRFSQTFLKTIPRTFPMIFSLTFLRTFSQTIRNVAS